MGERRLFQGARQRVSAAQIERVASGRSVVGRQALLRGVRVAPRGSDRPPAEMPDDPDDDPATDPPSTGNGPSRDSANGSSQPAERGSAQDNDAAEPGRSGGPSGPRGGPRRPVRPRRRGPLGPTVAVVVAIIVVILVIAQFYTDVLWYQSVGYTQVFRTEFVTKTVMFVLGGVISAAVVYSSLSIGYRTRPIYAPLTVEQQSLDRYREMLEPLRRAGFIVVPVLVGLFAGGAALSSWKTVQLWLHRTPFGTTDPVFHKDIGFFVFTLPWLQFLITFFTTILILAIIAAALTHYVYGGLQLQAKAERTTNAARVHLSALLAVLVLIRAAGYWVGRYALVTNKTKVITGIDYTNAHATLPAKAILALAAIVCAGLFIATIWTRTWRLPLVATVLLIVLAVGVGGIYPALVQAFRVNPSAATLEAPYISRNIAATRLAYGIQDTKYSSYNATTAVSQGQLRNDAATIPGIRLVDPAVVSPTFKQLQGVKNYYQFPDALDVDRYKLKGTVDDAVIAVRELDLNGVPTDQHNWINDHTVYTHGFGVVAAYGNQRGSDGQPVFFEQDIPNTGLLGTFQPRVYFGEMSPDYSIVGAPKGSAPAELDFPNSSSNGQQNTTYTGKGGVPIDSLLRRAAFALKYKDVNFLLSDRVNQDSRILYDRTPLQRVQKVAPWLTLDGDPYPAVVNGRIDWVVDGYTTSADYPYSSEQSLGQTTADSLTQNSTNVQAASGGQVNYIRNSVKATVDAYDGTVTLYAWDPSDPVLKTWEKVFPSSVQPLSKISGQLMSHVRYPEDLFKVQRALLSTYHVSNPQSFYYGTDYWEIPSDPTQPLPAEGLPAPDQPPYYLSLRMPGQQAPAFSLTTAFIPAAVAGSTGSRQVLSGFAAVDADAGSTAGKVASGYGRIRLLELPRDTSVKGPSQVQNDIESSNANSPDFNQTLSQFLTLNRTGGSTISLGNLLTLPVGGGVLYVEPIYVSAASGSSYPLERLVVAEFGDKLAWGVTLDSALNGVFGGNSGVRTSDAGSGGKKTSSPSPSPTKPPGSTGASTALTRAVAAAQKAYEQGQAALKKGDFAAYGQAQARLKAALGEVAKAAAKAASSSPTSSPSSSSPSTRTKPSPTSSK